VQTELSAARSGRTTRCKENSQKSETRALIKTQVGWLTVERYGKRHLAAQVRIANDLRGIFKFSEISGSTSYSWQKFATVSKTPAASIFRIKILLYGEDGGQRSFKTSVKSYRNTRRHNPETFFIVAVVRSDHIIADRLNSFAGKRAVGSCSYHYELITSHCRFYFIFRDEQILGASLPWWQKIMYCDSRYLWVINMEFGACHIWWLQFWRSFYIINLYTPALLALSEVRWICEVFNMNGGSESEKSGRTEICQEKSMHSFVAYLV